MLGVKREIAAGIVATARNDRSDFVHDRLSRRTLKYRNQCEKWTEWLQRPVSFPGRSTLDPTPHQVNLLPAQGAPGFSGWHTLGRVGVSDASYQLALVGLSGNNDRDILFNSKQSFLQVESQSCLALFGIGAVTLVAVVGKERMDVTIKIDGRCHANLRNENQQC